MHLLLKRDVGMSTVGWDGYMREGGVGSRG